MSLGLIFTYLCTYGGSLLALCDPWVGLLIYVCFAIIKPEALWFWAVPPGNYSRIVAIALLIGWGLKGFGNWKLGQAKATTFIFIGLLGWATVSALQARVPEVAWAWVEEMAKIVLPFVVGITLIDSVRQVKQLAWVICVSHGYLALEFNRAYLGGFNRMHDVDFGGMDNNCLAIAMAAGTGLAFFLGLYEPKFWRKLVAWGFGLLMGHCVLFSFSRGGMFGLLVMGVVAFFLIPKKPRHYVAFAVAVLLAIRLAGPEVMQRFWTSFADEKERDASAESRVVMWRICLDIIPKNPVLGVGPHNFPQYTQDYGHNHGVEAHNLWLQTTAELGLVGGALLIGFYGTCVRRMWWVTRNPALWTDEWFEHCPRMVVAALVGFGTSATFVSLYGLEAPYYIVLLGAGTLKLITAADPPIEQIGYDDMRPASADVESFAPTATRH
ncbi:MAG TPA: O-antigen ligase family protein [Gemmataceae bacterium]|nr:O-antigen ligase family protein [Gemmataceae bacterium]